MVAPALVLIAHGSADPRVAQVTHAIRAMIADTRRELIVRSAFLDQCPPNAIQVASQLDAEGVREAVLVPLDLTQAVEADPNVTQAVALWRARVPQVAVAASRPLGPELNLLNVLDVRLRSALGEARVLELDGLVLSSASSGDVRGGALLARRARQWSTHHRLPVLTAVADGTGPSVVQAIQGLRSQGRRHIAVGSFFLTADEHYQAQADLAQRAGAVAISEPFGAARELVDLILARYAFAAMDLLDFAEAQPSFADLYSQADDSEWASA